MEIKLVHTFRHPLAEYAARIFNRQKGYRFTFLVRENIYAEFGAYLHWNDDAIVDLAIDISTMSGCAYKCKFCAASQYNKGVLSIAEIMAQIEKTMEILTVEEPVFMRQCPKITFSFEGMGEPTLPKVAENIVKVIHALKDTYETPDVRLNFLISTIGANLDTIKHWANIKIPVESLQISLHSIDDDIRGEVIGKDIPGIHDLFAALQYFVERNPEMLLKINFLLFYFEGKSNFSTPDLDRLIEYLHAFTHNPWLKISHLNETESSRKFGFGKVNSQETLAVFEYVKSRYPNTYLYGSQEGLNISCGQLASYAETLTLS